MTKHKETYTSGDVLGAILLIRMLKKFGMMETVFGSLKGLNKDRVISWDWKDETSDLEIEFEEMD